MKDVSANRSSCLRGALGWSEKNKGGWWIDVGVEMLANVLKEAMSLCDNERSDMGARGREYVQRYSWDSIAQ